MTTTNPATKTIAQSIIEAQDKLGEALTAAKLLNPRTKAYQYAIEDAEMWEGRIEAMRELAEEFGQEV